jgi:hypothetical protein
VSINDMDARRAALRHSIHLFFRKTLSPSNIGQWCCFRCNSWLRPCHRILIFL